MKAKILFPPDKKDDLNEKINSMLQVKIEKNPYGENVAEKTMAVFDDIIV
jgi:hypothetical protein